MFTKQEKDFFFSNSTYLPQPVIKLFVLMSHFLRHRDIQRMSKVPPRCPGFYLEAQYTGRVANFNLPHTCRYPGNLKGKGQQGQQYIQAKSPVKGVISSPLVIAIAFYSLLCTASPEYFQQNYQSSF